MPTKPGNVYHGQEIPARYAKVGMEEVCNDWKNLKLDIPRGDGETTLADATHGYILWNKRYIMLKPTDQGSRPASSQRPTPGSPPPPPSPRPAPEHSPSSLSPGQPLTIPASSPSPGSPPLPPPKKPEKKEPEKHTSGPCKIENFNWNVRIEQEEVN